MAFAGEATAQHSLALAVNLRFVLAAIWDNAFSDVAIENVELAVEMRPEAVLYELDSVVYDRGAVVPGQTLEIGCVLRRMRGERVTRTVTVQIPEDTRPGSELILGVGSPDRIDAFLGRTLARRLQSAEEIGAVIGILQDLRPANRLTTILYRRSGGVVSRGEAYSQLPPTAAHLLSETQEPIRGGTAANSVVLREEVELDGPVIGGERIRLRVRNGREEESR